MGGHCLRDRERVGLSVEVDGDPAGGGGLVEQLRDAVEIVGADEDVDVAGALEQLLSLQLGHAAADPDPQVRTLRLEAAEPSRGSAGTSRVAFSLTAQVLRKTKSASAALSAASRPRDCSSPATLSESLTFIWQPKVWMKKRVFPFISNR